MKNVYSSKYILGNTPCPKSSDDWDIDKDAASYTSFAEQKPNNEPRILIKYILQGFTFLMIFSKIPLQWPVTRSAFYCVTRYYSIRRRLLCQSSPRNIRQQSSRKFSLSVFKATEASSDKHTIFKREFEHITDVECLESYKPGGLHPVKIGDSLSQERYTILHKLGHGATSTIWLAVDENVNQLVAVKIKASQSTSLETKFLSKLAGQPYVRQMLDVFSLTGPNGTHQCLVLEAAQCSLYDAKDISYHRLLQLPVARAVAAQVILAVQQLHSKGIVHGGGFTLP